MSTCSLDFVTRSFSCIQYYLMFCEPCTHFPPTMSVNPSAASSSGAMSTKPILSKFSKEEVGYLKERLPRYIAAINQGPTKKGDKGEWVTRHILPNFNLHFGYLLDGDGPSMESINVVMENADSEDEPGTESGPPTAETRDLREEDRHMSRDALVLPQ